jgi:hypothetical protein
MIARLDGKAIERKIYFYRIDAGKDHAGKPLMFDAAEAFAKVEKLAWTPLERYMDDTDGNATCCWVDPGQKHTRIRVCRVRRSGLPPVEQAGRLAALPIDRLAGLAEQVHVIFFREGIAGVEFNFYGPRPSRLAHYILEKTGKLISFVPLLRQDVYEQLGRLKMLRLFELRIQPTFAATIKGINANLGAAFKAAANAGKAEEVEIVLRVAPHSKRFLDHDLIRVARKLFRLPDFRQEASLFHVRAFDAASDKVETVDVLSDALIAKKMILRADGSSRSVSTERAYAAIEEAYTSRREEIHSAAGIT